jgi:hypothetical protein
MKNYRKNENFTKNGWFMKNKRNFLSLLIFILAYSIGTVCSAPKRETPPLSPPPHQDDASISRSPKQFRPILRAPSPVNLRDITLETFTKKEALSAQTLLKIFDAFIKSMQLKLSNAEWCSDTPFEKLTLIEKIGSNPVDKLAGLLNQQAQFIQFDPMLPYTQKVIVQQQNLNVVICGDIHARFETVEKIITTLIRQGKLNERLELAENTYFIGLGDYVDRGPDSLRVLGLLMTLAEKNPENVILIRGNHENAAISLTHYGLYPQIKDLAKQEKDLRNQLVANLYKAYEYLPLAVYLGFAHDSASKTPVWQLAHAGVELRYDPTSLLNCDAELLKKNGGSRFDVISITNDKAPIQINLLKAISDSLNPEKTDPAAQIPSCFLTDHMKSPATGFMWNDICPDASIETANTYLMDPQRNQTILNNNHYSQLHHWNIAINSSRNQSAQTPDLVIMTVAFIKEFFGRISSQCTHCNIVGLLRGHQHMLAKICFNEKDATRKTPTGGNVRSTAQSLFQGNNSRATTPIVYCTDEQKPDLLYNQTQTQAQNSFTVMTIMSGPIEHVSRYTPTYLNLSPAPAQECQWQFSAIDCDPQADPY